MTHPAILAHPNAGAGSIRVGAGNTGTCGRYQGVEDPTTRARTRGLWGRARLGVGHEPSGPRGEAGRAKVAALRSIRRAPTGPAHGPIGGQGRSATDLEALALLPGEVTTISFDGRGGRFARRAHVALRSRPWGSACASQRSRSARARACARGRGASSPSGRALAIAQRSGRAPMTRCRRARRHVATAHAVPQHPASRAGYH